MMLKRFLLHSVIIFISFLLAGLTSRDNNNEITVGISKIEITPMKGIRLAGYRQRNSPFDEVAQELWAKAIAIGGNENLSIMITVDLLGVPINVTKDVNKRLVNKLGIENINLAINASHTHSGPMIGNIIVETDNPLDTDELVQMALYAEELVDKLVIVSLQAVEARSLGYISVASGDVDFAVNREPGNNKFGSVDHQLAVLQIRNQKNDLKGIVVNYACHAVTLGPENNSVHGDWVGETQKLLESKNEGAIAMVSIGCAGDQNSSPRMNTENPKMNYQYIYSQAKRIEDEVSRLLIDETNWKKLTSAPSVKIKDLTLSFQEKPDPLKLAKLIKEGNNDSPYARLLLNRMARSGDIPLKFDYRIQVWNFGEDYHMVFLPGEVVVDYGLRLKEVLGKENVWVNAYSNDMPGYIASRRMIEKGGYAAIGSMRGYEKPTSKLDLNVEEEIIHGVFDLLPKKIERRLIQRSGSDGQMNLPAKRGHGVGENIKYMPDREAFGWIRSDDRVEWYIDIKNKGNYEVRLEWSVSDEEAGKPFILHIGDHTLNGKVEKSGSWEIYKNEVIGEIFIEEGSQKVTFRSSVSFGEDNALLDLKRIVLIPKGG